MHLLLVDDVSLLAGPGYFLTPWPYLPNVHMNFARGNVMYPFIWLWAVTCFLWGCHCYFRPAQDLPAPLGSYLPAFGAFTACLGDFSGSAAQLFLPRAFGVFLVWTSVAKMCALEACEPAAMKIMAFASIFLAYLCHRMAPDFEAACGVNVRPLMAAWFCDAFSLTFQSPPNFKTKKWVKNIP